ncbi:MAG: iron-sulfur cluster co-chaperone HscB C-terminal domain-containing protein [Phycisphaerales bacterium]
MPDAFDVLGLPAKFDLTPGEVRAAYLARVGAGGGGNKAEGGSGEEGDAALNAAKMTLSDPEARANLLLSRFGGPSKEVSRDLPDGFLMQMMEVREDLEAAAERGDRAGVEKWLAWAEKERDGYVAQVGELFRRYETERSGKVLSEIRKTLNAWRYIERMVEQMEAL